ncbi:hypothetical protein I6A81_06320 [Frankia sp. CN7]|uniref:Uncharacterized protein n=1 Tax=Frankia nepalensis TaxID=1836974 RepID=A0A937UTG3_9ACTN|nr:hypothetical protein [Frankia nepalensis]MBL7495886.1 hypothetical protein [Frankia nepalensis]MBL7510387.1 hypothetical protein [Frankia nepalensis]MBL7629986.1 hypothetical protein [Frankia nepalensis]
MIPDLGTESATAPAADPAAPPPGFAAALAVADAVLYEGYLLYPYRRSSGKNRVRWQFGVLMPRPWAEANGLPTPTVAGSSDSWRQQTECLVEASPGAVVHVRLRFLHLQHRSVRRRVGQDEFAEVDEAWSGDRRYLTFDEAVEREVDLAVELAELTAGPWRHEVVWPAAESVEPLDRDTRIARCQQPVSGLIHLSARAADTPFPAWRLRLVTENTATDLATDTPRPLALRRALLATHSLLGVRGGRFLSLLDPPAWAEPAARACENLHTFPVLAGADDRGDGGGDVVLSAPIILHDHPGVAPESPGDLFDATEIDEILSLRTLTLTEEEKREARATDPRAAEIIDRVELIPDDVFARLHGAVRSLRPVPVPVPAPAPAPVAVAARTPGAQPPPASSPAAPNSSARLPRPSAPEPSMARPPAPAWWDPEADAAVSPDRESVVVDGARVAKGSRVRLRPRGRGGDAQDMFLDGREAIVEGVFRDVDDARHLAVILVDDPGADLHRWYGRHYYFAPDEVQVVLPPDGGAAPAGRPAR